MFLALELAINIPLIHDRINFHAIGLLIIANKMLDTGSDTLFLNTSDKSSAELSTE
tara:strand:- start:281 stop:448 length:168 start_codon:yes stop_codon:yes gene_type:complete